MNEKRGSWHLLTGLILGVLIGLLLSLLVFPVKYTNTNPAMLGDEDRDVYRSLIAISFLVEADAPRALARLELLNDPSSGTALVEQAQQVLSAGGNDSIARGLALLAALVNNTTIQITPLPVVYPTSTLVQGDISTSTITVTTTPKATRTPAATLTPRVTPSPVPTTGSPFALVKQENICEIAAPGGLIQVYVFNASGKGVPGIPIEVSLPNGGSERFFTGLYTQINRGYADYRMLEGMVYNLRVGETGELVLNLSIPECTGDGGNLYLGSIRLEFMQ